MHYKYDSAIDITTDGEYTDDDDDDDDDFFILVLAMRRINMFPAISLYLLAV